MKRSQIESIIPHREPFILIDEVVELTDDRVVAFKHLTGDEAFFQGHFPQHPIMPGVLIIEAMAQAGAVCVLKREAFRGKLAFFAGMDRVRFKRQVLPGESLRLQVSLKHLRGNIGFASASAYVLDELAARADLMFAIQDA